ncbi:MAG: hypothetical protein E6J58_01660 [Deltaproteobacteria bacterium]|nr:MAG: hypothetical protein E6J58_01660 [Deltaproteobacteria bacterium]
MFSVRLVARPDPRMVEVPLEIEAELPRDFEGSAQLASSGLPRRVRMRAPKDSLKLSTAYRTDQLAGDIVRTAMRGTVNDIMRVQDAVMKFIRAVRERRQDGATLVVSSNGRGKIDIAEHVPAPRVASPPAAVAPAPEPPPRPAPPPPPDRLAVVERRVADLEAALSRVAPSRDLADRIAALEQSFPTAPISRKPSHPLDEDPDRSPAPPRRATAIEAYAEGLRMELRARATGAAAKARAAMERGDRAAALAADAGILGAPQEGIAQELRDAAAHAAARQSGLTRLAEEIEFYAGSDLSMASQLLTKLEETTIAADPAPALESVSQAVAGAAKAAEGDARASWLQRAAALCAWQLVDPKPGQPLEPEWHEALDTGGTEIIAVVCPGLKRSDGTAITRARVLVDPKPKETPPPAPEHAAAAARAATAPAPVATLEAMQPPAVNGLVAAALPSEPPPPALPVEPVASALPAGTASVTPLALLPAANGSVLSLLDLSLSGETEIRPEEAAAAAAAAARATKVVADDATVRDEALAAVGSEQVHYEIDDSDVEEIHTLVDPVPAASKESN